MIITSIQRFRGRRVDVVFDTDLVLQLSTALAAEHDLRAGQSLTRQEIGALLREDERRRAYESAVRFLAYRPRSERELSDRLRRKALPHHAIDDAVGRLRKLGYLDDAAFARFWTDSRQAARPSARWLVASELKRKGIDDEIVGGATEELDDEEAAYAAAARRARTLRDDDYERYRERLGRFLTQRGFSYDVARRTIGRCWSEREGAAVDA
jgi:regulatory protein